MYRKWGTSPPEKAPLFARGSKRSQCTATQTAACMSILRYAHIWVALRTGTTRRAHGIAHVMVRDSRPRGESFMGRRPVICPPRRPRVKLSAAHRADARSIHIAATLTQDTIMPRGDKSKYSSKQKRQ